MRSVNGPDGVRWELGKWRSCWSDFRFCKCNLLAGGCNFRPCRCNLPVCRCNFRACECAFPVCEGNLRVDWGNAAAIPFIVGMDSHQSVANAATRVERSSGTVLVLHWRPRKPRSLRGFLHGRRDDPRFQGCRRFTWMNASRGSTGNGNAFGSMAFPARFGEDLGRVFVHTIRIVSWDAVDASEIDCRCQKCAAKTPGARQSRQRSAISEARRACKPIPIPKNPC